MPAEVHLRILAFRGNEYQQVIRKFIRYLNSSGHSDLARVLVATRNEAEDNIAAYKESVEANHGKS